MFVIFYHLIHWIPWYKIQIKALGIRELVINYNKICIIQDKIFIN